MSDEAHLYLNVSVFTVTEQKDGDERKLTCSVSTLGKCYHSVRLLFEDKDVKDTTLVTTHESECSSSVTVPAAPVGNWTDPESLTCVVAGNKRYVQNFTFIPQASGNQGAPERSLAVRRSGAAAFQVKSRSDEKQWCVQVQLGGNLGKCTMKKMKMKIQSTMKTLSDSTDPPPPHQHPLTRK
ncbi:hypothetical protein INR49_022744 [Caranx melampygus]|nr:hypothetical protein INR49_022744 [Caranx melampygus]